MEIILFIHKTIEEKKYIWELYFLNSYKEVLFYNYAINKRQWQMLSNTGYLKKNDPILKCVYTRIIKNNEHFRLILYYLNNNKVF